MESKETEGQTLARAKQQAFSKTESYIKSLGFRIDIDGNYLDRSMFIDECCKLYHSERLKIDMPTEEEIEEKNPYKKVSLTGARGFASGAKWIRDLILKTY